LQTAFVFRTEVVAKELAELYNYTWLQSWRWLGTWRSE